MDAAHALMAGQEILNKELIKIKEQALDMGFRFTVAQKNDNEYMLKAERTQGANLEIPLNLKAAGMKAEQVPKTDLDIIAFICYLLKDGVEQQQVAVQYFGPVLASQMQSLWSVVNQVKAQFGQA